ncbi:ABC transporter ATP-binding protein [Solemya pervernicosa gill symbiont]|uniref:ABC transporter ATP-binding protein n=1 Tax=Solemya pervernicosa gill symbiont TaxID=642797 RepID=A0A1T2L057_9GAMM|nr:ATP-binding cassette domain-containing protein [Solemya pervernicosa gill symbiont]OOZ38497.1 ABC transporter ATP-binding protein [Solemya pervernicosa gill symbiont]
MNGKILISVESLTYFYDDNCAIDDLSFKVKRGEVLGFLGPNGAGKSTTMQMITGNIAPSAGGVTINGIDLLSEPKRAKAELGYLPEQPPLYRELTVDEYLRYCAKLNRIARVEIETAINRAKTRCGLVDVGSRLIGNLSKGYQQRVGIAQAIIHNPAVVILDEPTVGLDPIQIREIRQLIRELGNEHGVILSTHILPEVQATCSRVQIIHQGKLLFSDTMDGLDARLSEPVLRLKLSNPPPLEMLTALPGIESAERSDAGYIELRHSPETNPAGAVAEAAVVNGWGVLALTPHRKSLEQIFVELTTGATGEEPAA